MLLQILNCATNKNFSELLPIPEWLDKAEDKKHYIAFEAVSYSQHLNERTLTRGSNCTSVDALMIAKNPEGIWLIPIEWKYTENYYSVDKSQNKGGETRWKNYEGLIRDSKQLNEKYLARKDSIYFQEPYYQLMRQTLWAELSLGDYGANNFLHLHIVPEANKELINRSYKRFHQFKDGMEKTWSSLLKKPELYLCKDPKTIFASIKSFKLDLYNYLLERYWKD